MLILHMYAVPKNERQIETDNFLDELRRMGYQILDVPTPTDDDYSYQKGLKPYWGKDDLVLINHDVVPTIKLFEEFLCCKYESCTIDTPLMPARTGHEKPYSNARSIIWSHDKVHSCHVEKGDYCEMTGFDCVKISKALQLEIYDWFMKTDILWSRADADIGEQWAYAHPGQKLFHIHRGEVRHNSY